jgi:hypothetical protein
MRLGLFSYKFKITGDKLEVEWDDDDDDRMDEDDEGEEV